NAFLLFLLSLLLISCDRNAVLDKNIEIPDYRWDMNNILKFDVEIPDTLQAYNIYVNFRHASGYAFSNIFLFLTTKSPSGMTGKDTVELTLADSRGKWLGDGSGDIWDNRILFKKDFHFPEAGKWNFELQQAMRVNPLPQVMDAGMRVEKSTP